ncbi:MAG: hypothetical protein V4858_06980 [Pseudomonadota bacterium]
MNTHPMHTINHLDCAEEHRMTRRLEKFALTLLCVGLTSVTLTALTALNALAAQPGAMVPTTTRASAPGMHLSTMPTTPGTLSALKAAATVEMNTPLTFHFMGTGYCKLSLVSGDGYVTEYKGELPFTGVYTYSSGSMTSFEAFKNYTASVTLSGNCKTGGFGPFVAKVRVVNPHPQSAGTPPAGNTVGIAGTGKIAPIKP